MLEAIIHRLKSWFPQLHTKLRTARLNYTPEEFIKRTLRASLNLWVLIVGILGMIAYKVPMLIPFVCVLAPLLLIGLFFYLMQYPQVQIFKRQKEIDKEIIFAGRFLVIETESGVPLYNAFLNIVPTFPHVGRYFREIITKVDLGTSMEDAINEAILYSPSPNLRRLLWQVLNSIKIGSEVKSSLSAVVENIVRDQSIQLKEYAKKLNPMAMFYMMIAIIIPTLGSAMLAVLTNFISVNITLPILLALSLFLALIQFMFLNIIRAQRPPVEF